MPPRKKSYDKMYEPKEEVKVEKVEDKVVDELEITPTEVKGKKFFS